MRGGAPKRGHGGSPEAWVGGLQQVTQGLGGQESTVGERQTDTPYRESLGMEFI